MNTPGIGAMLHYLGGGSEHDPSEYVGRTVTAASMDEERLTLTFNDGVTIDIFDDGQSCCESRYMRTDDDVAALVGRVLTKIEAKGGPDIEDGEAHETCFVEVAAGEAHIVITNHNEHNGYYGGFGLTIRERPSATLAA